MLLSFHSEAAVKKRASSFKLNTFKLDFCLQLTTQSILEKGLWSDKTIMAKIDLFGHSDQKYRGNLMVVGASCFGDVLLLVE